MQTGCGGENFRATASLFLEEALERITSRQNKIIQHFRRLGSDGGYRRENGEFVCEGAKQLGEAVTWGMEITSVLWAAEPERPLTGVPAQYLVPEDLLAYASSLKNSPGPIFSVKMKAPGRLPDSPGVILLDGVQDPGNVGTVIRTANAFGMDAVVLADGCADLYNPRTVRASMGAVFRQNVLEMPNEKIPEFLEKYSLELWGAALADDASDIRELPRGAAVAIGSEGRGLGAQILEMCTGRVIIPMRPECESLNAAVAASVIMWETSGRKQVNGCRR